MRGRRVPVALLGATLVLAMGTRVSRAVPLLVNPLEEILPRAEHVVRGVMHHDSGRLEILERFRGEIPAETVRVENHWTPELRWWPATGPGRRKAGPPIEGVFCLTELDGRYFLPESRWPSWITPHSAVRWLAQDGHVYQWGQVVNPGPRVLVPDPRPDHAAFLAWLRQAVVAHPFEGVSGRALDEAAATAFYAVVDPVAYHARRWVPGDPRAAGIRLETLIREREGLLRGRAVDAFLMIARRDVAMFAHEAWVDARVAVLLGEVGTEPFAELALDELRRGDVLANFTTMARILQFAGGEQAQAGRALLEQHVRGSNSTLASHAYWALVYTGRRELANRLRAERDDG